jgi:hypothetical protein
MKRILKYVGAIVLLTGLIVGLGQIGIARSQADPGIGCETIHWGLFGFQRRSVCDGPRRGDGSWTRVRVVWTPAHTVSGGCYGTYYISCYPPRYYEETTNARESYVVFDSNVLPDEPGWLPAGTDTLR